MRISVIFFLIIFCSCSGIKTENKEDSKKMTPDIIENYCVKIDQENFKTEIRSAENVDLIFFLDANKNVHKIIEKDNNYKKLDSEYCYYFNNNKLIAIKGKIKLYPDNVDSTIFEKTQYQFVNDSLVQALDAQKKIANENIYGDGELSDNEMVDNIEKIWNELRLKNKTVSKKDLKDIFESINGYRQLLDNKNNQTVYSPFI